MALSPATILKDSLLEKTATSLQQPLNIVEDVMRWVFKDVVASTKLHSQIELSGFGTMMISQGKLRHRIEKFEKMLFFLKQNPSTPEYDLNVERLEAALRYFYSKQTNETKQEEILPNMGGLPQPPVSPREDEGGNSQGGDGENGNM